MTENHNKTLTPELKEKLSKIKHLALDMDGTIYMGSTLFPFTTKFLADMKDAGISYSFLTNNPSKSVADYLKKLAGLGIEASEDNMYTTSLAAIDYIKSHYPEAKRLFLLGTPSMITQFEKAGYISCADDPDDVPDIAGDTTGAFKGVYLNRFTQSTYTPGSIFKIVTASACLEEKLVSLDEHYRDVYDQAYDSGYCGHLHYRKQR